MIILLLSELRVRVSIRFPKLRVGFPLSTSLPPGKNGPTRHGVVTRRMAVSCTRNSILHLKSSCGPGAVHLGVPKVTSLCCVVRFLNGDSACAQHVPIWRPGCPGCAQPASIWRPGCPGCVHHAPRMRPGCAHLAPRVPRMRPFGAQDAQLVPRMRPACAQDAPGCCCNAHSPPLQRSW